MKSPIILALDTNDLEVAKKWVSKSSEYIGVYKLGLEFFLRFGKEGVQAIKKETDSQIFLDLKLHDIPNTVGAATSQVAVLAPRFLTVHASGGSAMIKSAVENGSNIDITAVTILTSLGANDLKEIGYLGDPESRAVELAKLATTAGAKAIVCSPLEIAAIRSSVSKEISIITPGIRTKESAADDQRRTLDPKSAIMLGANYLVVGRPITGATDISAAAKSMFEEATA
jgi:orotidine-5'-phosphate decarboxylase